jgi:hypothetical protein
LPFPTKTPVICGDPRRSESKPVDKKTIAVWKTGEHNPIEKQLKKKQTLQ